MGNSLLLGHTILLWVESRVSLGNWGLEDGDLFRAGLCDWSILSGNWISLSIESGSISSVGSLENRNFLGLIGD